MPHEEDPVPALFELLGRESPELRPICRWLLLGPYLGSTVLGEYSRPPTVPEMVRLKRLIEQHGAHFNGLLDNLIEASGQAPAVRLATHLDRLLELDPALWTHPAQVLDRPHSDTAELLEACRSRMAEAGEEERERLAGVEEKLARAVRIEDSARARRARRGGKR